MADEKTEKASIFFTTIDRIEEDRVLLELPDKEMLAIPLAYMPDEAGEGDRIKITCERAEKETFAQAREAKDILNDILHSKH